MHIYDASEETWRQVEPPVGDWAYMGVLDFNDCGTVALYVTDSTWSDYSGFLWRHAEGHEELQDGEGNPIVAFRLNNWDDWIGWVMPNWAPASSQLGFVTTDENPWTWWEYSDINDFGETMGTFQSPATGANATFLNYGSWFFQTGLPGEFPFFDTNTSAWQSLAAMDNNGVFVGAASGRVGGASVYQGFIFDGSYKQTKIGGSSAKFYCVGLDGSGGVLLQPELSASECSPGALYADGVGICLKKLTDLSGMNLQNGYPFGISRNGMILFGDSNSSEIHMLVPDQDQDADGMSDDWETAYGLNPLDASDAFGDADGDGTNNYGEFLLGSDPNHAPVWDEEGTEIDIRPGIDTDGDGMPNVWEWENGLDHQDAADAAQDPDRDGYTNLQEYRLGTDPHGAPSYRFREVGPLEGLATASMSGAVLGDGQFSGSAVRESVYFTGRPLVSVQGGQRPAEWSVVRGESAGQTACFTSHGTSSTSLCAQASGGAALSVYYASPRQFFFWKTPDSAPVPLSGAVTENNIYSLSSAKLSPGGDFLVARRQLASSTSTYDLVVWKMPAGVGQTYRPVTLSAPSGVTLSSYATLFVNDHGFVAATATSAGKNAIVLWQVNAAGTAATPAVLPWLPGGTSATVVGISNQPDPFIAGNATIPGNQTRAAVWHPDGTVADLGVPEGGSDSAVSAMSPGGIVAGTCRVLSGASLKYQAFTSSWRPASASWSFVSQGDPCYNLSIRSVNDAGEVLGTVTPASGQSAVPTLWRHGRGFPLDSAISAGTGYHFQTLTAVNSLGTLFGTCYRDGALITVLLTPDSDTDGDGLPDAFENEHGFNAFAKNNPSADSDSDGLPDLDEYRNGTSPRDPDTDGDGMKDGWEVSWGLLPLDPSDALLDPDGDRVTNLRESQIGTTPTGIHRVEIRFTDTSNTYPSVLAADDAGNLILSGQSEYSYDTDPDGYTTEESSSERWFLAAGAANAVSLPPVASGAWYDPDWTDYWWWSSDASYGVDPSDGSVHGAFLNSWEESLGGQDFYGEDAYLMSDAITNPQQISYLTEIEQDLRDADPPLLSSGETLYPYATAVSPSATRRLYQTSSGRSIVLDEQGQFIGSLPTANWQAINDEGEAFALATTNVNAANGLPTYYAPELRRARPDDILEIVPIPHEPGVSPNYSLRSVSTEGTVLLSRTVKNSQLASSTRYELFDPATGTLCSLRRPGISGEGVPLLSLRNDRLVGNGAKPYSITPDGTCIQLAALRIQNTPGATPVPFGTLYPKTLTPAHIASDGAITLTTTNSQNRRVILRIAPHNDADHDGVPDDWEMAYIAEINEVFGLTHNSLTAADFDVDADYGDTGMTASEIYFGLLDQNDPETRNLIFSLNTLFPSTWASSGYQYYDDKLPVRFRSFVMGASCDGQGIYHSSDPDDIQGYKKLEYTKDRASTEETSSYSRESEWTDAFTASVGSPSAMFQVNGPTDYPTFHRFWDPEIHATIDRTVTTNYHLAETAPDSSVKTKVVNSGPGGFDWKPWTSTSADGYDDESSEYPTVAVDTATTTKGGKTTNQPSTLEFSIGSGIPNEIANPWIFDFLELDFLSGDPTHWSMDWGDETETFELSSPVSWRELSDDCFEYAKSRAKVNPDMSTETIIRGDRSDYTEYGQYRKVTWKIEGPPDRDHVLAIKKYYWRWNSNGYPEEESEIRYVALTANESTSITEEADPGDEWETVEIHLDLLPVEVVELAPKLVDETDTEIADSDKPAVSPIATAMVERDPLAPSPTVDASTLRIAWRDMKVRLGQALAGKAVTWSMTPQFTPLQEDGTPEAEPRFRGKWGTAENDDHKHKFSASSIYGEHNFESLTQAQEDGTNANVTQTARTIIDTDGYTSVRVNLPPIGFNKARICIGIESVAAAINLIDLEVPAVIVIDSGHGSGGPTGGSADGSIGLHTGVHEYDSALDIGTRTLNEIERITIKDGLMVKKYSAKLPNDPRRNIGLNDRERKAREVGADTYVSIHFDGATNDPNSKVALYRNPFGMIDQDDTLWNRNPRADWALARRVRMAVQDAISEFEPMESIQASESAYDEWDAAHPSSIAERLTSEMNESRLQKGLGALNDGPNPERENGNYRDGEIRYVPCRAALIELERTANEQADCLFNGNTFYNEATGEITLTSLAEAVRANVAMRIAEACIEDALVRDLSDRADVPVRTSRAPQLDFEND
ncbi:MAG: N-acetylmuramoyl-L-alanine amidase [Verrucomicrobiae bacterium]|nr:N-acetylmuramoyl-L-alanine amidase [Verrucomicrobiae bacterium]